jgi:hypothetical protein
MEMQQIIEMLARMHANMKIMMEVAETYKEEMLARMDASQAKADANTTEQILAKMEANRQIDQEERKVRRISKEDI